MAESERGLGRRTFIKQCVYAGAATLLGAGTKAIDIENRQPYTIPEEILLERISKRPDKNFLLGIYPNSLPELQTFKKYIGGDFIAGAFANERTFRNEKKAKEFVDLVNSYHKEGGIPLIAIGLAESFNDLHPFDIRNEELMTIFAEETGNFLNQFPYEVWVRPFFEPEFESFSYGINHGLPLEDHQEGFKRSFAIMSRVIKAKRTAKTQIHFSPWVDTYPYHRFPIDGYYPGNETLDGAGGDGYDFYPGRFEPLNSHFWEGKISPEETFGDFFGKLLKKTNGQKPLYVYESGSATDNSGWLKHAVFYAMSIPQVHGFVHFGEDKRKSKDKINWTPSLATIEMYGSVQKLIINS
ncbi:MAG TPA: hypothetical protein VF185_00555 [Patescibacteria group bacterium]